MGLERSSGVVLTGSAGQPGNGEELVRSVKPFGIAKRVVWEAWRHVKANRGAAGIDDESIEMFEANLKDKLYRVWNRMSSGSYFPPAVRLVEIEKKSGGVRTLGIPTVEDRIAQTVVKIYIEPALEQLFHPDSYGYRLNKSALQAVGVTRERCWEYDWVVEFDIHRAFDELDHDLLMRAVRKHVKERWAVLYIERWLKAPFAKEDGMIVQRSKGVPQGSVIGPVLMNLFMHYGFDRWMQELHHYCPFARYADDAVVHCKTEKQAQFMLRVIGERLGQCGLQLNLKKSGIVYCKDSDRREGHACKQFTFLGFTFRPRVAKNRYGKKFQSFLPAVSREAMKEMLQTIRRWKLSRQTSASIMELATRYNPILRGWWNYYGRFYKTALRRVFDSFEATLARWVRRKYKKLLRHEGRSYRWIWRVARRQPRLFVHWRAYGQAGGRAMGAV
ncbi:MAG: group II intron reverse transcriptase/maturase [Gammaproteobacteria bacterium]